MPAHPVADPRAWRAATIDECRSWYYPLSERCLAALDEVVGRLRREPRPTTKLRVSETPLARCAGELQPAQAALAAGRGFIIIEAPPERCSPKDLQIVYWLVGQLLGKPVEQNVEGTLLYDVRDEGKDVRYGARFSVTSAETGFHTDNSFGEHIVDYVGLLCLNPAKRGGLNQVVSGCAVYHELRASHPDVLAILEQPFHIERRAGLRPGESPTVSFPVLQWDGDAPVCRYLRYWIEAGHERAGQPLNAAQTQALNTLDAVLREPELHVEFGLKPGDMFFINNRWIGARGGQPKRSVSHVLVTAANPPAAPGSGRSW